MSYDIPTLPELCQRAADSFRANLKGSDAALWPNNVAVSAKVMGGAVHEPFQFLEYISRQINKSTAEGIFLERHAADFGLTRLPATFAEGAVDFTGDAGIAIPVGIELQRSDGLLYATTTEATTDGLGQASATVRCLEAGKSGNALSGISLAFTTPLSRIATTSTVSASGIGLGADTETDSSLRERLLFRLRYPPMGGAVHDYVAWVRNAINGVTRVFVDPVNALNGRESVGIWFMMDDTYADGIPQSADVSGVADYLETVKPAGAVVTVAAPVAVVQNLEVSGLSPDTTQVRDSVQLEQSEMFRREMRVSTLTEPFTLYQSLISEAVANATGEHHHNLITPSENTLIATGSIPTLGTITFS